MAASISNSELKVLDLSL